MLTGIYSCTAKEAGMPQLPPPPSKRRTASRIEKLDLLYARLRQDRRLTEITSTSPTFSEREICTHVQIVLDDYVQEVFQAKEPRKLTWGQISSGEPMPCVEVAGHRYFPDHIILKRDFSIAIEVKRYTGQSSVLQQVVGQSVIYAKRYGFVIAFIADVTKEGNLAKQMNAKEQPDNDVWLLGELWHYHNTAVVCRHVRERFT